MHLSKSLNKLERHVRNVSFPVWVYLDLKKAFHTVNHDILLTKLEHYCIKGNANYCFLSFLTDIKQYTSVKGNNSQEITHGFPKGSVYYVPYYLLYFINGLNLSVTWSKSRYFADNSTLLLINKSLQKLISLINHD